MLGIMKRYHSEVLWEEKSYEDAEAEIVMETEEEISNFANEVDVPFEYKLQESKLRQNKEGQNRHPQSKKGTIKTAPKRKNDRKIEQAVTGTEEEGSMEKQDEKT